jgi:preprotein translocase SecF subunit
MWWASLLAVFVCFLVMSMYILWRFRSLGFSLGAVGALVHDALVILTLCLICDYEISTNIIVAILMVLGYSINDTIIIFARIRENVASLRGRSLHDIVNISINETLRRTLLTTFSTLLVVIPLVLFGVLPSLSVALLVGFIFGTYSSIYVASPIMLLFSGLTAHPKSQRV